MNSDLCHHILDLLLTCIIGHFWISTDTIVKLKQFYQKKFTITNRFELVLKHIYTGAEIKFYNSIYIKILQRFKHILQ